MTGRVQSLLLLIVIMAAMSLVNCSPYSCGVTFGSSTCAPSGSGSGSGGGGVGGVGGGGSAAVAFAFAVDQQGSVAGYTLNSSTFQSTSGYIAPAVDPGDPAVGMVIAQKQFVYAVFELENKVYGWSISSTTGALTTLSGFPLTLTVNAPIATYNQYNVATNPGGTLLFISDTVNSQIFVYQITAAGALTPATGSPFSTGLVQPANLATDGLGKYLYVTALATNHQGSEVLAYSIGIGTNIGILTPLSGSPFPFPMWQLQGDASGAFLIGTTGRTTHFSGSDDNQLYVFSIQPSGATPGAISQLGSPFATQFSPFNIAVEPVSGGGEFVYSFSINDAGTAYNPIEGFLLDPSTGALTAISGSPFGTVATGHWGQFDQSGALLFVYGDVLGGSTSTQLSALAVSSTGVLTQPIPSLTLATPGYWVVTDP